MPHWQRDAALLAPPLLSITPKKTSAQLSYRNSMSAVLPVLSLTLPLNPIRTALVPLIASRPMTAVRPLLPPTVSLPKLWIASTRRLGLGMGALISGLAVKSV